MRKKENYSTVQSRTQSRLHKFIRYKQESFGDGIRIGIRTLRLFNEGGLS